MHGLLSFGTPCLALSGLTVTVIHNLPALGALPVICHLEELRWIEYGFGIHEWYNEPLTGGNLYLIEVFDGVACRKAVDHSPHRYRPHGHPRRHICLGSDLLPFRCHVSLLALQQLAQAIGDDNGILAHGPEEDVDALCISHQRIANVRKVARSHRLVSDFGYIAFDDDARGVDDFPGEVETGMHQDVVDVVDVAPSEDVIDHANATMRYPVYNATVIDVVLAIDISEPDINDRYLTVYDFH